MKDYLRNYREKANSLAREHGWVPNVRKVELHDDDDDDYDN